MSEERLNELFSIVDEGYSSIQEREIRDYITNLQQKVEQLETQQKEFINYLENESKEIYRDGGLRQNIFRQILQKYKEITGILDGKENI